ncbi:MAG: right-handed parallel beta-helix repeat-containing protein, partial [Candidatus Electryonea clarkiae]|nr:right-handed parallel beta-helix repeat-containing protein [Candidatus Electryonea clarkiae]
MKSLKRIFILVLLPIFFLLFSGCEEEKPKNEDLRPSLEGLRTADITAGSYIMTGDVIIDDGENISIDAGVNIFVQDNYKFLVKGKLSASGSEDNMIHFTTDRSPREKGDWKGIWFVGADEGSILEYVQISFANKYDINEDTSRSYESGASQIDTILHRGAITIRDCSPTIRRCIIDNAGYDGIHIVGESNPKILYNTIALNAFNGIRIEPDWTIGPEEYFTGDLEIKNNIIVENDDAGIRMPSGGEQFIFDGMIEYNDIWNNTSLNYLPTAITDKVSSEVHLDPQFVDIQEGDFELHPCSGAIDKGNPDDGSDLDGTRPDLGVFPIYQDANHLANSLSGSRLHLTTDNYPEYFVTCDVVVEEGDELIIDPGVRIRFVETFSFIIRGKITAIGSSSNPIVFTSDQENPERGDWKNIFFDGASSESRMEHVII